ncbi:hypothetical protein RIF29_38385 [Crotalaria pallida]|uniref:Uncharacterized protein n=1 Tax=Crotalaria pallida TaxID=3830 RepID=A0AAN9E4L9_CROPI
MEPAKIDWKRLEWNFVEDELYEHINAPKWFDFLSPHQNNVDDEAWFCRPDCKHPRTAEDFLRPTTPFKTFSPGYVSENIPLGDQNRRDLKMKRRVQALSSASPPDCEFGFKLDSENQDPNLFTTPINQFKSKKLAIKSSEEKKEPVENDSFQDNKVPSLRSTSTLSAKNLFAGRPILNQITEFCNELKKLATRAREREIAENLKPLESEEVAEKTPSPVKALAESNRREKERKPLLDVAKVERPEGLCVKGKQQIKKPVEAENMPLSLDLQNLRDKRENIQPIRTNPPSPQCFSANRGPNKTSKASKSRLMAPWDTETILLSFYERGVLGELEQNKEVAKVSPPPPDSSRTVALVDGRETKALDMLWFFKPCTLSG